MSHPFGEPQITEKEYNELVVEDLLARAAISRADPVECFSFVMKEETSRETIEALPFQRVLFSFVNHHHRCVVRMPVGFSKTYCMGLETVWLLGNSSKYTDRGAVISATAGQAEKPLGMVADYIKTSAELGLVFPDLQPSTNVRDPWTQTKITVERPPGIRDPSLSAIGVEGALPGARLSWILVDDILDDENTATPAAREKVIRWFFNTVLGRRDVKGSKIVVTNTPWHPEDLTYKLEEAGWPTLEMEVFGDIRIANADEEWDSDELRPSKKPGMVNRLTKHDDRKYASEGAVYSEEHGGWYDVDERVPLWPERYSNEVIERLQTDDYAGRMHEFNQSYRMICRDEESAACKVEWIDRCKMQAREAGIHSFTQEYTGSDPVVGGLDIAIGQGELHHFSAFFFFRVREDGKRIPLFAEKGKWPGIEIVRKLIEYTGRYNAITRVESNAAQVFIRQWALSLEASVTVRAHFTGRNKRDRNFGVHSVFTEIENGAWLIPNDPNGRCPKDMQAAIDDCIYYKPPPAHTGDLLMAWWFAREQARSMGLGLKGRKKGPPEALGASILAR